MKAVTSNRGIEKKEVKMIPASYPLGVFWRL